MEDVIYNVLLKVKDEKERFADIITELATMNVSSSSLNPENIRGEIIAGIDKAVEEGSFPTKEQIHMMAQFVQVQDFYYKASLSPSATKEFKMAIKFSELTGFPGQFTFSVNTAGSKNNIDGSVDASLNIKTSAGDIISSSLIQTFTYQADKADSKIVLKASASNTSSGSTMLDFELKGTSSQLVDPDLNISIPVLTAENSMNMTTLIEQADNQDKIIIFLDDKLIRSEVAPFIQDSRTLIPVRAVSEALGCEVQWIQASKEVLITRGSDVISMFIGENVYTVNGVKKQIDTKPIIKDNYTFIPVRFLTEALNCNVKWQEPNMVFITTK